MYVQEVPSAVKAIAGVSTSTPGFIGLVPDKVHQVAKQQAAPGYKFIDYNVPTAAKTPKFVTNFTQFTQLFGDLMWGGDPAATASTDSGAAIDSGHRRLWHAVYGFFNNGGSSCYVARVTDDTEIDATLNAFAAIDEIAMVCFPGDTDSATYGKLVDHCAATGDRFAILDAPSTIDDLGKLTKIPSAGGVAPANTDLAAWYFPWIRQFDPAAKLVAGGDGLVDAPPSGHMAGIYARVDNDKGVHKAPANEVVRGALDVTAKLSKADQDLLNPKGVNCIRVLNGNILAWGARTVGGDANADLKYINVRRTLLFLRESIDEGTQWVVFEPNTPALWQKIARNVTAFLTNVWRSGALFGTTAAEAFYVKCDAETNPPELREVGQVVTEIGVAIVRPAEFVIFKLSQFTAPGK
ncbi:MAG TPA: phage tail sheath subtilisin-like domain-containing protein [Myxococcales bacterium]|nr:phage tail sheath subtilisin-like domain-containing protein [Myxococcales bacterium]